MSRKRSPETEVRHLRRELRNEHRLHSAALQELEERRRIGAMMANICFNGAQQERVPEDFRISMSECRKAWDSIKRTCNAARYDV